MNVAGWSRSGGPLFEVGCGAQRRALTTMSSSIGVRMKMRLTRVDFAPTVRVGIRRLLALHKHPTITPADVRQLDRPSPRASVAVLPRCVGSFPRPSAVADAAPRVRPGELSGTDVAG